MGGLDRCLGLGSVRDRRISGVYRCFARRVNQTTSTGGGGRTGLRGTVCKGLGLVGEALAGRRCDGCTTLLGVALGGGNVRLGGWGSCCVGMGEISAILSINALFLSVFEYYCLRRQVIAGITPGPCS